MGHKPLFFPHRSVGPECIYTRTLNHPFHFDPEDGGRMLFRNVGNTAHIHKGRMNANTKLPLNPEMCS
jgi:hypothetical protein